MTPGNPIYWTNPPDPTGVSTDATGEDPTGDICRVGYYCPDNSSKQFSCDPGYFMPFEMAIDSADCILCPNGKYCDVSAMYDLYQDYASNPAQDC